MESQVSHERQQLQLVRELLNKEALILPWERGSSNLEGTPAEGLGECDTPSLGSQGEEPGDPYSEHWWPSCDILHPHLRLHGDQCRQHYSLAGRAEGGVECRREIATSSNKPCLLVGLGWDTT